MVRFVSVVFAIFAVSMVECGPHLPTPYLSLVKVYKDAVSELLRLLPHPNSNHLPLNDTRLHYGLLASTVDDVAKALNLLCGHTYDSYYESGVVKGVTLGLENPQELGRVVRRHLDVVHGSLEVLLGLVEELCPGSQPPFGCEFGVDKVVNEHPDQYGNAKKLLLEVAKLSKLYLEDTYEHQAQEHVVLQLLVKSKAKLKPLVLQVSKVLNLVHLNSVSKNC